MEFDLKTALAKLETEGETRVIEYVCNILDFPCFFTKGDMIDAMVEGKDGSCCFKVRWDSRMTRKGAISSSKPMPYKELLFGDCRIILSPFIWSYASNVERVWILAHEVCHAAAHFLCREFPKSYLEDPRFPKIKNAVEEKDGNHGKTWQSLMKKCGCSAERFHRIVPKHHRFICECEEPVPSRVFNTPLHGKRVHSWIRGKDVTRQFDCVDCKQPIILAA